MKTLSNYRRSEFRRISMNVCESADHEGYKNPGYHIQIETAVRSGVDRKIATSYYDWLQRKQKGT